MFAFEILTTPHLLFFSRKVFGKQQNRSQRGGLAFKLYMPHFCASLLKSIRVALPAIVILSINLSYAGGTNELALWLQNESITWVGPTNGLWAGVSVYPSNYPEAITIFVLSSNTPKGLEYILPPKSNTSYKLELQDSNGKTLSSFGDTPPQKIPSDHVRRSRGTWIGHGIDYDYFPLAKNAPNQFKDIVISDVIRVKREGDYTLIISPMLYKFETNRKTLTRVDLPRVIKKVRLKPPQPTGPTNSVDSYVVVIDAQSGQYAAVSGDGHVLALKDRSGKPVWTNDIVAKFGTKLPRYSNGRIESLEFIQGLIVVYLGNMSVCIDPQSGKTVRMDVR